MCTVKNDGFSMDGGLGGDFCKDIYKPELFGIVEVFCVVGLQEMRIPTLKCRFYMFVGWGTCTYTGSTGSFFLCLEVLEGTFVRTRMRQSCLDAYWKCYTGNVNTDAKISIVGFGDVYE